MELYQREAGFDDDQDGGDEERSRPAIDDDLHQHLVRNHPRLGESSLNLLRTVPTDPTRHAHHRTPHHNTIRPVVSAETLIQQSAQGK
jgi:hypothetical protein